MFVTLLLPVIVPYGCPVTFFHPVDHHKRKVEFFRWVEQINLEFPQMPKVQLLHANDVGR